MSCPEPDPWARRMGCAEFCGERIRKDVNVYDCSGWWGGGVVAVCVEPGAKRKTKPEAKEDQ